MLKYFWDTQFAKMSDYGSQIRTVVKYLIQNRSIVVPSQALEPIYQIKPYSKTIINELFERCVNTGYINEFASVLPIDQKGIMKQFTTSIPELLTTTGLVVDFKNNPNGSPLSSYSELNNKLLINLAGIVKRNDVTRNLIVSDINELHSMYVRSMLVRSFSVSDGWLSPSLSTFIVKTYALSLASMIGKTENLSFPEQMTVAMIFALYMSQQFARNDDDPNKPRNFYKCTYLGSISDLENIAARASERTNDGLTLQTCCELIAETGPQRLQKFNIGSLYRLGVMLGSSLEPISTRIALEYAPYFTFMILNVLSGSKGGSLQLRMKENRLIGSAESKRFLEEIKVCQSLFINR